MGVFTCGKASEHLDCCLTYVYASETMLWGCFGLKLRTKYPLTAKHWSVVPSSFPKTYDSTERTLRPSWCAAKCNLWLVSDEFVDFMKGPVKKNSPLSPTDDNSYVVSAPKNSWITLSLSWEIFLKRLKTALSKKKQGSGYCLVDRFGFLHALFILFSTAWFPYSR